MNADELAADKQALADRAQQEADGTAPAPSDILSGTMELEDGDSISFWRQEIYKGPVIMVPGDDGPPVLASWNGEPELIAYQFTLIKGGKTSPWWRLEAELATAAMWDPFLDHFMDGLGQAIEQYRAALGCDHLYTDRGEHIRLMAGGKGVICWLCGHEKPFKNRS